MIDRLDLRIPAFTAFTPEFDHLYVSGRLPWLASRLYRQVIDLRPWHRSSRVYLHPRFGGGDGKLELIDAGSLTLSKLLIEIESVFACDPMALSVLRIDLAADISGVSVEWFKRNARLLHKRAVSEIGTLQQASSDKYGSDSQDSVETYYIGRRPNILRCYDKKAELLARGLDPSRDREPRIRELPFIRVEQQFGGGRIPRDLATFGDVVRNATSFDPFSNLVFVSGGKPAPDPAKYPPMHFLAGVGLRQTLDEMGSQRTIKLLNVSGNASRIIAKLRDFLPASDTGITKTDLLAAYRASIENQFRQDAPRLAIEAISSPVKHISVAV